jgi:excisionase family DNA binding protein
MPNPAHARKEFLDVAELSAWLHITVRHVRRLVAERRIPYNKVGRLVRFRRTEIDEWLAANEHRPPEQHNRGA